jgi:3-phenylpropionate/trans-cinnamate dioxygenase ferredoxin subunit
VSERADAIELGDLSGLVDGELRSFDHVGPCGVVVCRVAGTLFAIDDNCSHADTPLSEGRLRGFSITCPLHGASFDVRDGSHSGPPAWEGVPCHRVVERDGGATLELGTVDRPDDDPPSGPLRMR